MNLSIYAYNGTFWLEDLIGINYKKYLLNLHEK